MRQSNQAIGVPKTSNFWQGEVGCQLVLDEDGRTLEATIGVFLEDGSMVTARVFTAIHHGLKDWNQLGIQVSAVVGMSRGL